MLENIFITSRIKELRICYDLSLGQLSYIFGKSKAAFSQIESGKKTISHDLLVEFADFFAVSLDWLTGRSDEPYSLSVIQKQEKNIIDLEHHISLSNNTNLIYLKAVFNYCRVKSYFSEVEKYSLSQRANVLYALNFWKYAANKLYEEGYDPNEKNIEQLLNEISLINSDDKSKRTIIGYIKQLTGTYDGSRLGISFANICHKCIEILDDTCKYGPAVQLHYEIKEPSSE